MNACQVVPNAFIRLIVRSFVQVFRSFLGWIVTNLLPIIKARPNTANKDNPLQRCGCALSSQCHNNHVNKQTVKTPKHKQKRFCNSFACIYLGPQLQIYIHSRINCICVDCTCWSLIVMKSKLISMHAKLLHGTAKADCGLRTVPVLRGKHKAQSFFNGTIRIFTT
jgi:hypothetical protein